MQSTRSLEWWRPEPAAVPPGAVAAGDTAGEPGADGRVAFAALIAFTVILVASPQEHFPILRPLRIALVAGVVALVAYWVQRLRSAGSAPRIPTPAFLLAGGLLAWSAITIPASVWRGGSLELLLNLFVKSVIVFLLLGLVLTTQRRLLTMVWTLSLLLVPLAGSALQQYAAGHFVRGGRIDGYADGIAGNPNDLALLVAIILPLTLALALTARRWMTRALAAGLLALGAAAVVATFSRSGFLVLVAVALLYVASLVRRGAVVLGMVLVIGALAALPWLPVGFDERLATIADIESDQTGSAQQRWRDMTIAAQYVAGLPLVGAGLGMNVLVLNELRGPEWVLVHNVYLQYGMDLGIPGLALFLALLGTVIAGAGRAARALSANPSLAATAEVARAIRVSLVAFAFAAFFYPVAYHFYFFYLAGLAVAVRRLSLRRA